MKTLSLSIKERVIFPDILPESGRKIEMILCNDLLKKIEFTPAEVSEFKLNDAGSGRVTWDVTKEKDISIVLTDEQIDLLQRASKEADDKGKVTRYNLSLLQKIDEL